MCREARFVGLGKGPFGQLRSLVDFYVISKHYSAEGKARAKEAIGEQLKKKGCKHWSKASNRKN